MAKKRELEHIKNAKENIEAIKNVCKVYKKEQIEFYPDEEIREIFKNYDYLIEIKDYDTIIKNSVLENELSKIDKLKIIFTQLNDTMLKEKGEGETDDLEETNDKEILNRGLAINLFRRGFAPKVDDEIYLKNKVDTSYNEIKSYYLDIALSWQNNHNFERIAEKLKRGIASQKQEFTIFRGIYQVSDGKKRYVLIMPELTYNNERFGKEIYKLFIPYTALVLGEVIQVNVEESSTWEESPYPLISVNSSKVIEINRL